MTGPDQVMSKDPHRLDTCQEQAAAMKSSHDAVIGMTRRAIVSSWSPAAQRLYGYSAGEIVGRSAEVLYPPWRRPAEAEIMSRIADGEEVGRTLTDRVHKDGMLIPVLLTASPV